MSLLNLFHRSASEARPTAIITPNARGGWSMLVPAAGRPVGNYGTARDASRHAVLSGFNPHIEG